MGLEARLESMLQDAGPSLADLDGLAEAESILAELAAVFFQAPLHGRRHRSRFQRHRTQYRGALPGPARPDPGGRVHGLSRPRYRRSLRQPSNRSGAWDFLKRNGWKTRCAGTSRSTPTTRSAGARKPPTMFLSGKPLRSVLPRAGPRRPRGLVSLRSPTGPPRRRPAVVHSRRGLRHHRAQAGRGGACRKSATWSRRCSRRWARWWWCWIRTAGSSASTAPANRPPGYSFQEVRGKQVWELFQIPGRVRALQGDFRSVAKRRSSRRIRKLLADAQGRAPLDRLVEHGAHRAEVAP